MSDDQTKFNVDISAGASIKAEVKTELPPESSGRLLDALTDIIRPFSERRGLRADQVRLQREIVLIEIAKLARERLEIEGETPRSLPNRVLVPLLEKASLAEEDDDLLKQKWAALLASSSIAPNVNDGVFVDVLGKLDSLHVKFLEHLCRGGGSGAWATDVPYEVNLQDFLREFSKFRYSLIAKDDGEGDPPKFNGEVGKFYEKMDSYFDEPGSALIYCGVNIEGTDEWFDTDNSIKFSKNQDVIVQALEALGLIKTIEVYSDNVPGVPIGLWFHLVAIALTHFGAEFVVACGCGSDQSVEQAK